MTVEATNAPVTAEPTISSKANSAVTFSDLEAMDAAELREKKESRKPERREAKPESAKDETGSRSKTSDDEGDGEEKKAKPAKKAAVSDAKEDAEEPEDKDKETKPRAKAHKFRSGEDEHSLSGDSVTVVTIDGKNEEVTLQELKSSYSGKVQYDRKFSDLAKERQAFEGQRTSLNSMVENLLKKAQTSPDEGFDFLAELAGKDPVEFKTDLIRKQRAEAQALAAMNDDEFESFLRERSLGWREKRLERTSDQEKAQKAKTEAEARLSEVQTAYGIEADDWTKAHSEAAKILDGKDPTPEQVVYASRWLSVEDLIKTDFPELAKHAELSSIVNDVVSDMLRKPTLKLDQVRTILSEVWSEKPKTTATRRLSEKVRDEDDAPPSKPGKKSPDAALWDDID